MQTPYFLISQKKLDENITAFQDALRALWPNSFLSYSVKTNSLPWVLKYLKEKNILAEVVSDEEYELALLCGYDDEEIVFNGPIKGENVFKRASQKGAIVNLDSINDIRYLKRHGSRNAKIGIRINVNPDIFDEQDIEYRQDGFRFGFSEENGEFKRVLDIVHAICGNVRIGLHLHCNSITRRTGVYSVIARYAANIIKKYELDVFFIDMGGGYFGGVPGKPTPYEYILAIKKELSGAIDPDQTILIVEPGSAIIGSAVDLYTSVIDVKDTMKARIVTTDGSRIHIDPLWRKKTYMYSIEQREVQPPFKKQIICGYTCMDHDRLMIIEDKPELKVRDKIIYHRVGSYTMTFGGMFIRYFPDVYVYGKNGYELVRSKITVDDYFRVHSLNTGNITTI